MKNEPKQMKRLSPRPSWSRRVGAAFFFLLTASVAKAQTLEEARSFLVENFDACPEGYSSHNYDNYTKTTASISPTHILTIESYKGATLAYRAEVDMTKIEVSSGFADRSEPARFRLACSLSNCMTINGKSAKYTDHFCATSAIGGRIFKALTFYVNNVPRKKSSF